MLPRSSVCGQLLLMPSISRSFSWATARSASRGDQTRGGDPEAVVGQDRQGRTLFPQRQVDV